MLSQILPIYLFDLNLLTYLFLSQYVNNAQNYKNKIKTWDLHTQTQLNLSPFTLGHKNIQNQQ